MQFVVIGRDGNDDGAVARRQSCRPDHLELCKKMNKEGRMLFGAALFSETGVMNGSMIVLDVPSRDDVDRYLEVEPYVKGNVWKTVEVTECRVGDFFLSALSHN